MTTNDTSNSSGQFVLELVEILKRLGSHRRTVYSKTYGNESWTRDQSDAYWYHPLVRACDWLETRVGISRHELEQAAFRLTTPLGLKGMEPFPNPDGSEGDPGMPDWLWMTGKLRELDLDGTTGRDSTTTRLWRHLSEEYPKVLTEAGLPVASQTAAKPPRSISAAEAEIIARRLHKEEITFSSLRAKDMAKLIAQKSSKSCSESLVKGLPYWDYAMTLTGRGRGVATNPGRIRGTVSRPMSLTKDLEAVTGEGEMHEVLEDLAEDEEKTAAERAVRDEQQAIDFVERSRLTREAKRQIIAKLKAGEMTPQEAVQVALLCPTRNQKSPLSHD